MDNQLSKSPIPDSFYPLRVDSYVDENGEFDGWGVWTRHDPSLGSKNNFTIAECQMENEAIFICNLLNAENNKRKVKNEH